MDDGPYWVILLMYGSHNIRHTGFRRLTLVNETPGFWGVTIFFLVVFLQILNLGELVFGKNFLIFDAKFLTCLFVLLLYQKFLCFG